MADRRVVETLFQQYSPDLAELLNHCVPRTTIQLYSKNLVTKEVKEWTQSAQGVSDFEKAVKVLSSAETILKHSPDLFNVFLSSLIAAESSFDEIVEKISKDYEKLLKVADEPDSTSGCSDESQNSKILDDTTSPSTDETSLASKETPSGEHSLEVAENLDSKDTCPSPDAKSASKPNVGETIQQLENKFLVLQKGFMSYLIKNKSVTADDILMELTILPSLLQAQYKSLMEEKLPSLDSTDCVRKIVHQLNLYVDFMNYSMLQHLIKAFGNETHNQDISAYAVSVEAFLRETTVQDLIDHWPGNRRLPPDAEELVAMIDRDPKACSIQDLLEIKNEICSRMKISVSCCLICRVGVSNSFILTLIVPSVLADNITLMQPLSDHILYLLLRKRCKYIYISATMKEKKDGMTPLYLASQEGHADVVALLLDKGANVDQQTKDGFTALRVASVCGHTDVVRLLVTRGATVNIVDKDGNTPLYVASANGHKGVVDLLLDKGANVDQQNKDGFTPLYVASQKGHKGVVDLLLDKGANIDQQNKDGHTALRTASFRGHTDVVRLLVTRGATVNIVDKDGGTPLYVASQKGHADVVSLLLNKGANVDQQDKDGSTPLYLASQEGHADVVALLLDKGANVDQQTKEGSTALIIASQEGHTEVAQTLISKGAAVDHQDEDGWTALHYASAYGHPSLVDLLIKYEAKLDIQTKDGMTALCWASYKGEKEIVEMLINVGANLNIQNEYGRTALCWASHEGEKDIVEMLINAGANLNIQDEDEMTALTLAIQQGHKNVAFTLIKEKAADLNITDKTTGWSAIFFTAKQGFTDVARQLLDRGADVTLKDKNGVTAFNIAKLNDNEEICDLLMNYYNVDKTEEKVTENQKKQVKLSYQRLLSSLAKRLLPGREEKRRWEQSRKNQNQTEATTFNVEEEDIVVAQ